MPVVLQTRRFSKAAVNRTPLPRIHTEWSLEPKAPRLGPGRAEDYRMRDEARTIIADAGSVSGNNTAPALVILRSGRVYLAAAAHISDGFLHANEVRRKVGSNEDATYLRVDDRSWPRREIAEVRWRVGA